MESASFINAQSKKASVCNGIEDGMFDYLQACESHHLQIHFYNLGINLCHLNIRKNPLAHYTTKARLSFPFAVCLRSELSSNDYCIIEIFLQPKCKEDACGDFYVDLLLSIINMKLKRSEFK